MATVPSENLHILLFASNFVIFFLGLQTGLVESWHIVGWEGKVLKFNAPYLVALNFFTSQCNGWLGFVASIIITLTDYFPILSFKMLHILITLSGRSNYFLEPCLGLSSELYYFDFYKYHSSSWFHYAKLSIRCILMF